MVAWDGLAGNPDRTSYGCIMHPFRNGTRLLAALFVACASERAGAVFCDVRPFARLIKRKPIKGWSGG